MIPVSTHPIVLIRAASGEISSVYIGGILYRSDDMDTLVKSYNFITVVKASGQRAWIITDSTPHRSPSFAKYINQVYIASPGVAKSEANKVFTRSASLKLITRIWSLGEINQLFSLVYSDEKFVEKKKVHAIYAFLGGIPRSIFNDSPDFRFNDDGKLTISEYLLGRLAIANWERIFETMADGVSNEFEHDKISSVLFHIVPRPIPRELYGRPLAQRSIVKWASSWIATEATNRLRNVGRVKSALFCLTGTTDYRAAALVGHVYEGLCYTILTRTTEPVKCRLRMLSPISDLSDGQGGKVDLQTFLLQHGFAEVECIRKPVVPENPAQRRQGAWNTTRDRGSRKSIGRIRLPLRRQAKKNEPDPEYITDEMIVQFPQLEFRQFESNDELVPSGAKDYLWVPSNRFYEGINAIIPNMGICLQMTTRDKHPVSLTNIKELALRRAFPSPALENAVLLLFVVPKERFPAFNNLQQLTQLGNESLNSVSTWLHQAVLELDFAKEHGAM